MEFREAAICIAIILGIMGLLMIFSFVCNVICWFINNARLNFTFEKDDGEPTEDLPIIYLLTDGGEKND